MAHFRNLIVLTASLVALAACTQTASTTSSTATDDAAVRTVNTAWEKAYNAGDGAAVAALYAEDGVLSAPGTPAVRGKAAIGEYYAKAVAASGAAGNTTADDLVGDIGVSGDLAWQWGTYKVTDKSGAVIDAGKYTSIFQRKDGKWLIIRDTWNSDAPSAPK